MEHLQVLQQQLPAVTGKSYSAHLRTVTEDLLPIEKEVCVHCNYIFTTSPALYPIPLVLGKSISTLLETSSRGVNTISKTFLLVAINHLLLHSSVVMTSPLVPCCSRFPVHTGKTFSSREFSLMLGLRDKFLFQIWGRNGSALEGFCESPFSLLGAALTVAPFILKSPSENDIKRKRKLHLKWLILLLSWASFSCPTYKVHAPNGT